MPTVLRILGYRIGFFSADGDEPPHVHVAREERQAKFWLRPVQLAHNAGFRRHELNEIARVLEENNQTLLNAWNEYFG
jgi:hypothetical protein